jgi:hypothetical protein
MARASLEGMREVSGDHVISYGQWPTCSPDLTFWDFYLWQSSKDKVYKTNPHTLEKLKKQHPPLHFSNFWGRTLEREHCVPWVH